MEEDGGEVCVKDIWQTFEKPFVNNITEKH